MIKKSKHKKTKTWSKIQKEKQEATQTSTETKDEQHRSENGKMNHALRKILFIVFCFLVIKKNYVNQKHQSKEDKNKNQ